MRSTSARLSAQNAIAVVVRLMLRLFHESKKCDRPLSDRLPDGPLVPARIDRKPERWQQLIIKLLRRCHFFDPQINVIK